MSEQPPQLDYASGTRSQSFPALTVVALSTSLIADLFLVLAGSFILLGGESPKTEVFIGLTLIASLLLAIVGAFTGVVAWSRRVRGRWEIVAVIAAGAYFITLTLIRNSGF